jgi:hypothetical protein
VDPAGPERTDRFADLAQLCELPIELGVALVAIFVPLVVVPSWTVPFDAPQMNLLRAATGLSLTFAAVRWGLLRLSSAHATRLDPRVKWALLAFAGVVVASTAFSIAPEVSFWGNYPDSHGTSALNLLTFLALTLITGAALWRPAQRARVAAYLVTGGSLVSLYGISQFVGKDPLALAAPGGRIIATLGNAIFVGDYLVITTPFTAALGGASMSSALRRRSPGSVAAALVAVLALAVQLAAMLLTQSRGPFLGLAVGVAIALGVLLRSGGLRPTLMLVGILGITAAAAIGLVRALPGGQGSQSLGANIERVANVGEFASEALPAGNPGEAARPELAGESFQTRLLTWRLGLEQSLRRPWLAFAPAAPYPVRALFGYGPDTSRTVNRMGASVELLKLHPGQISYYLHNLPLQILSDLGTAGFAASTFFLVALTQCVWRRSQPPRTSEAAAGAEPWLVAAVAGALFGHLAEQLTGVPVAAADAAFWIVAGLACGAVGPSGSRAGRVAAPFLRWQLPILAVLPGAALVVVSVMSLTAEVRASAAIRELDAGRPAQGERLLREAADTSPWPPYYELLLAAAYANGAPLASDPTEAGRLTVLAGRYLDSELRQDPWNVTARSVRAWTHTIMGIQDLSQRQIAVRRNEELLALAPPFAEPPLQYASALMVWGRPNDAISLLDAHIHGTTDKWQAADELRARAHASLTQTGGS